MYILALYTVTLLPSAANAYLNPVPLPRITVNLDGGKTTGELITSDGSRVVLTPSRGTVTAIPTSRIRSATIVTVKRPKPKRVITLILG